ncbi:DNA-directed RNA polymerase I subunit RPA43 [Pangasianodon hypophthalmus]|uniref:DNA-directed RNA polymerase I subunit RPA43 n=1 Tax=Pangasianodon hypophthalmus TaxID=310915 RepID=UPI002307D923|nr:DNA-directed RNA polymerase I subunit RPA43 [Pangasianodon hypophthalmus]
MANLEQTDDDPKSSVTSTDKSAVLNPAPGPAPAPAPARDALAVPCLIPSFAEARELVPAPYSCLVLHTHRRHVALPPMYLNKKRTGIQQELNADLLKYSNSLKGVPLAYDGIKIIGHHGDIFDDQGYIHLNIEASFVIFKPKKGETLVGVINKIGVGHVGCLVHGCFNASVVKPAQLTPEQWRDSGLKLGSSLKFEVFQLDADVAGVLLIRGRLEKSRVQELIASFSSTETEQDETVEVATEPDSVTTEDPSESSDASKPKKKKKKKDKERDKQAVEEVNSNQTDEAVTHDVNGNRMEVDSDPSSRPKEKTKKKKKDKKQESDAELPSPSADLPGSDSSGYISDKSSKKRKAQEDELLQEDSDILPAKKKKKMK